MRFRAAAAAKNEGRSRSNFTIGNSVELGWNTAQPLLLAASSYGRLKVKQIKECFPYWGFSNVG